MSDILYHYCGLDTFKKIIETKTLRLSEIGKSNDYMEIVWLKNRIIPQIIFQRFGEIFDGSPVALTFDGITYKGVIGIVKMLEWLVDRESKDKMFEMLTLACCFSKFGDLLSRWRGYADDAQGISIGINGKKLYNIFNIPSMGDADSPIKFGKVRYTDGKMASESNQDKIVIGVVDSFLEELKKADEHNIYLIITKFLFSISNFAPIYKNNAFSAEDAWRPYINYPYPSGDNPNEALIREFNKIVKSSVFLELKSYVRNNRIIFYTEFNWAKSDLIEKIYIGPKCGVDKDGIKKLLAACNVKNSENIKIEKSRASYR